MRFQFRYVLLTYAQCGELDPWTVSDHLSSLGAECIIGRESHADGGIHLHAFVDFGQKFRSRKVDVFDVGGYHPNVSPSKGRPGEGWDYATKDGDVVAGGLERPNGSDVSTAGTQWSEICNAESEQEFWDLCETLAPRALLTNFTSLRAYATWRFRPIRDEYVSPRGITFHTEEVGGLDAWVRDNVGQLGGGKSYPSLRGEPPRGKPLTAKAVGTHPPTLEGAVSGMLISFSERRKSLILWGPSRLGKTLWARSLRKHAYFGGLFSMDESLDGVEYAVFDDIGGLKFLPSYKFWLGHQKQFYVTDKYKGKQLVEWGKPSIWLSNNNPLEEVGVDYEWLVANCDVIGLDTPIFRANSMCPHDLDQ